VLWPISRRITIASSAYVAEASPSPRSTRQSLPRAWTFLTNHAQVLLAVAKKSDLRVREIAAETGITERYAYRVLRDLERAGYVDRRRDGRSNVYRIHPDVALGDPLVAEQSLWQLLRLIGEDGGDDVEAMSLSRPCSGGRPSPSRRLATAGRLMSSAYYFDELGLLPEA
jgi:DNA-binding transcriptional ArsR family regulator